MRVFERLRRGTSGPAALAGSDDTSSDGGVIGRADRLMAEGRFDDALSLLHAANRSQARVEIERRIAQFRHEAFFLHEAGSREPVWPPPATDLFPGVTTVPEIASPDLSIERLRSGVLCHGALVVRGLLEPEQVRTLAKDVRRSVSGFDEQDADNPWYHPLSINPACPPLTPADRHWTRSTGGCFAADSPRALVHYLDALVENGVVRLIDQYLGERPALAVKKTTLRKVPPRGEQGWHQDGAFLGEGIRTLNLWVALTPCGVDAPTLDMVPKRLTEIAPTGVEGAAFDWSVSDSVAERVAGEAGIQRLVFEAGDAVFFDEMNLHRTAISPDMTRNRLAIESWFFAPSCYPLPQLPLLV